MWGVYTAIVTPFEGREIDWEAYNKLIEMQIEGGVSGIVPAGTTGENPVLSEEEQEKLIKYTVEVVNGRAEVIAGTGGNSTDKAVRLTKYAEEVGADGGLVVTPYYNKPTPEGIYQHFKAVNDSVGIDIVVYNVPGRTGKNIDSDLMKRLSGLENIKGVKEASGDINQIMQICRECNIKVLAGDDTIALPLMSAGGAGVISVTSNLMPGQVSEMAKHALDGDFDKARETHYNLWPLYKAAFFETNPVPIKYMLARKGFINEEYRLPLVPPTKETKEKINRVLDNEA